jgi:cytoskeleton protein RodZ
MSAVISDQQSGPKVAEFFSPGPGERLRAARLSMGFDIGKIASELHLTSAIVERLEADDYEGIGARVFVRGYLRNYARIVEMPTDSILRQFDEKWPDNPAQQSMLRESPRLPADGSPSRGWAGAVTWLIVVGLIALFLMWWQGYLDELVPQPDRTADIDVVSMENPVGDPLTDAAPSAVDPLPTYDGSLILPTPAGDGAPATTESTGPVASAEPRSTIALPTLQQGGSPEPTVEAVVVDGAPVATDPMPAPESDPAASQIAASGNEGSTTEPEVGEEAEGGAPVVDATTGIVMTFSAPCWVDVRDSSRKFKLFGEMPKGARRVLGGEPPYKLVIGNARAVTIEVNGEPFDITRYAKGNVARFTLNP